jgi:exopolyphosphatase/pppGpp-phosphohydrolase
MPATIELYRTARPGRSTDGPVRLTLPRQGNRDFACPIHQHLERWVARKLGGISHERRVANIATELFEISRPLHGLRSRDLRLLRWAAVVHDVGRSICDETHPEQGAALVLDSAGLPLTATDRRYLAYLTLYHRGKVPEPGRDDLLARTDDHGRLLRVLALLRAADGLDNRALARKLHAPPKVSFGLAHRANGPRRSTLHVSCYLEKDSTKARRVYQRRKKFKLLEELLRCEVVPQIIAGDRKN